MRLLPWLLLVGCSRPFDGADLSEGVDAEVDSGAADSDGADSDATADTDCGGDWWAPDLDGDGIGVGGTAEYFCDPPGDGWTQWLGDCDDTDPRRFPGNPELCDPDGIDEDCDLAANDADPHGATDAPTWYVDADGDGYGGEAVRRCVQPEGTVVDGGDCDDGEAAFHPGAAEACAYDAVDEDCDGAPPWYLDEDGDGWGGPRYADCVGVATPETGDCDDADPSRSPGEPEICADGVDQDCDGHASGCGIEGAIDAGVERPHVDQEVLAVGDLDGDGALDLLTSHHLYEMRVLPGPFGPAPLDVDDALLRVEVTSTTRGGLADLDGDGRAELIVGSYETTWVHVGVHGGDVRDDVSSWKLEDARLGPILDHDGDGDDEFALIGVEDAWESGPVWLIDGSGLHGGIPETIAVATLTDALDVAALGDVDGDGAEDLAWVSDGHVAVLHGPARGELALADADAAIAPADGTRLPRVPSGAGDLDGDGRDDVVVAIQVPASSTRDHCPDGPIREIRVFRSPIPSALADADATIEPTLYLEGALGAGDLDGDGLGDLVVTHGNCVDSSSAEAFVLSGPLEGVVDHAAARARVDFGRGAWGAPDLLAADLDHDGISDLALTYGRASWLLFGGAGL